MFELTKKVKASFGQGDENGDHTCKWWPITMGANATAGMDDEEFKKCITTNVLEFFPDAADTPRRCVMPKVHTCLL